MKPTNIRSHLRLAVNGLAAFAVELAKPSLAEFSCVGSELDLELLEKLFQAAGIDYGRDGMVEFANQSPALKELNEETGAELFVGFRYGHFFAGTGDERYPLLLIGTPSEESGIERRSRL